MTALITDGKSRRQFESWLLGFIYPVPGGTYAADYAFNDDLSELTVEEQKAHLARIKLRLLLDPRPCSWLIQRHRFLIEMTGAKNE